MKIKADSSKCGFELKLVIKNLNYYFLLNLTLLDLIDKLIAKELIRKVNKIPFNQIENLFS